jgi:hypothetical protein
MILQPQKCRDEIRAALDLPETSSELVLGSPSVPATVHDRFFGRKGAEGVWKRIVSAMPFHQVYVEPFLGTGWVMLHKLPALTCSIGVDVDADVPGFLLCSEVVPNFLGVKRDALELIPALMPMAADWLLYADPPYLMETRSYKRDYYRHEFSSVEQHQQLLNLLRQWPGPVMISGYASELYARVLSSWACEEIPSVTHRGKRVLECLWKNFEQPSRYHDTRFLGENFRDRERIKRKKGRWLTRLRTMSPLDRTAILAAIDELQC